jgi:uncharacterized protein
MNITQTVLKKDIPAIRDLLSQGADVDERDKLGRTPLMQATIDKRLDIMKLLLDSGASVDIQDKNGWSALHFAAQAQLADGIELLASRGATIDITDSHGNTPLNRAVFNYRGNGEPITRLLSHGADKNLENNNRVSPASLANRIANYDVRKFF